jgi:hypothetical protein
MGSGPFGWLSGPERACNQQSQLGAGSDGNGGGYKMPGESVSNPHYWLDRARIARIKSDQARNPQTKRMLSGIAEAYERLAKRIERRLRTAKKTK